MVPQIRQRPPAENRPAIAFAHMHSMMASPGKRPMSALRRLAALVALVFIAAGCAAVEEPGATGIASDQPAILTDSSSTPTPETATVPEAPNIAAPSPDSPALGVDHVYELLDALPSRGFVDGPDYERDDYLDDWPDTDGDCQNDRAEVLIEESQEPAGLSNSGCSVSTGIWLDPYFGDNITSASEASIDHVVALAEAHWAGGHAWTNERRRAYATDLGDPDTLVVTTRDINFDKGALAPQDWMPDDSGRACSYAIARVRVMTRWSLAVRDQERDALENAINLCPVDIEVRLVEVAAE
jgi:hypothetical protein